MNCYEVRNCSLGRDPLANVMLASENGKSSNIKGAITRLLHGYASPDCCNAAAEKPIVVHA